MKRLGLWLRWSWRDLRARWMQVAAIALVIALGTGSYAGLSSVTRWRRASTDDAYALLNMYDLRIELAEGSAVPRGSLEEIARSLPGASALDQVSERLIADIQVDASTPDEAILVPGTMYGLEISDGGPPVNGLSVVEGRPLENGDVGEPVALIERNFSLQRDLPPQGTIRVTGDRELQYVGQALTPEYFLVTSERGGLFAAANFVAVFTSLETAQELSGAEGMVNDLVLTLQEGADRAAIQEELRQAFATRLPEVGATITTREEDPAFRLNDADIDGDQQIYVIFAVLIFTGAVVAAFNLTTRIVESQRREIGIAMVLGVPPIRIAIRPLLVGAQIALLGVVFGVVVGLLLGQAMASLLKEFQPLPRWDTSFQFGVFASVGVIGFLVPFVATAWPVLRAVRVPPIEAVRPAYRSGTGGGLAPLLGRLRLRGSTFARMPVRNIVRAPRRAFLTALGIAAAIAALVAFVGLIDSFLATVDRGNDEILADRPERLEVELDRFYPANAPQVQDILASPAVREVELAGRVGGALRKGDEEIDIRLELLALDNDVWTPTISDGELDRETLGVYIAELAARNLDVSTGDTVVLRHPRLEPSGTFSLVETEVAVLGTHPHPFRFITYMDSNHAELLGLAGAANVINVLPAEGVARDDVKRELFPVQGVTSVQGVGEVAESIEEVLAEFVVVFRVIEVAMLALALLIAFNSASINIDERNRENATMFAFGVPVRTVLRMAIVENMILGAFATAGGILGGWFLLRGIIALRIPDTLPDLDVPPTLTLETLVLAFVLGVIAVALAPLLTVRKLQRMNVAATLKVIE